MQSIDSIKTYVYGTRRTRKKKKEEIKCNNKIKNKTTQKLINFDDVTKENIKEKNPNCSQIPNHPYIVLIIRVSRSGKTNSLFNLIIH